MSAIGLLLCVCVCVCYRSAQCFASSARALRAYAVCVPTIERQASREHNIVCMYVIICMSGLEVGYRVFIITVQRSARAAHVYIVCGVCLSVGMCRYK